VKISSRISNCFWPI